MVLMKTDTYMKTQARKSTTILATLVVLAMVAGAFVWSGIYNIGADDPHMRATYLVLETLRDRSIEVRAENLSVPDLSDPARATQGAGNYDAMCVGCHLAPGIQETELSKGLYPAPPNLSTEPVEPAEAFWVIKHGIKASGMPAWGKSMDDSYIWNMAAFLQTLPTLDAAQYRAMVIHSGGHSHGGGESGGHEHTHEANGSEHHHDDEDEHGHAHEAEESDGHHEDEAGHHHAEPVHADEAQTVAASPHDKHPDIAASHSEHDAAAMITHRHADGTVESHPAKPGAAKSDDHHHD
jgi:mono/diheme cytochrome c family protein